MLWQTTRSTEPVAIGSGLARSPWISSHRGAADAKAVAAAARARGLRSIPSNSPPAPTRPASSWRVAPLPQPRSRTRAPGAAVNSARRRWRCCCAAAEPLDMLHPRCWRRSRAVIAAGHSQATGDGRPDGQAPLDGRSPTPSRGNRSARRAGPDDLHLRAVIAVQELEHLPSDGSLDAAADFSGVLPWASNQRRHASVAGASLGAVGRISTSPESNSTPAQPRPRPRPTTWGLAHGAII